MSEEFDDDLYLPEGTRDQTVTESTFIGNNTPLPQPLKPSGGTIKITCNKENARITINNMDLGTVPFYRNGFQPGFYNIELHHDGCRPFSKMILIENNDTIQIDAQLEPAGNLRASQSLQNPSRSVITEKRESFTRSSTVVQGTIIITCNIDDATIQVNNVNLGNSPVTKTGLPGYYEIEIKKEGYKVFNKIVKIEGNDTIAVQANLLSQLSRLIVTSTPLNANVILNNKIVGVTPFDSSQITPAGYDLRLELPDYVSFKKLVTLKPGTTDTFSVTLNTVAFSDSVKRVRARKNKVARRIIFGISTAASVSGLIYSNHKVKDNLTNEKSAWNSYMQAGLSGYEYDKRFEHYKKTASSTDRYIKNRKIFTVFSIIGAAGFTISIPL